MTATSQWSNVNSIRVQNAISMVNWATLYRLVNDANETNLFLYHVSGLGYPLPLAGFEY